MPTLSKIVTIHSVRFRCAIIGYRRRSVDEYLVRADVHRTHINFVCNEYDKFDEEQKYLSPALFLLGVPVRNCIPGFAILKNPCNLNPWSHYSSVIDSTLHLERKFQPSLPEDLSLLQAWLSLPTVPIYTSLRHLPYCRSGNSISSIARNTDSVYYLPI